MRSVYVNRKLSRSVTGQFVAPAGQLSHVVQRLGGCHLLESEGDASCTVLSPPALKCRLVG